MIKWNDEATKYIYDEYRPSGMNDHEKSRAFNIKDLEVAFTCLWVGLLCSSIVFIIEIAAYKISSKKLSSPFSFVL